MSVQVAAVLEDFVAVRAAVNTFVLSGFVPLVDSHFVRGTEQVAAL